MASPSNKTLTSVEKTLMSVLLSSPGGVALHRLEKEYKEVSMEDFPLRKLGFSRVEDFIRSIPHCAFITQGRDGMPVVQGVATEKTQHVARLVTGQRKPKKKKSSKFAFTRYRSDIGARLKNITVRSGKNSFNPNPTFNISTNSQQSFWNDRKKPSFFNPKPQQGFSNANINDNSQHAFRFDPKRSFAHHQFVNPKAPARNSSVKQPSQSSPLMTQPNSNRITNQQARKNQNAGQSSNYVIPPRMKRQQNGVTKNEQVDTSKLDKSDLRFTINRNKLAAAVDINIKENVFQLLTGFKNGLWEHFVEGKYAEKFGEAPENLAQLIKDTMTDVVDANEMPTGKYIFYAKKKPVPVPTSPSVQVEKSKEPLKMEDLQVVVSRNNEAGEGSTRNVILVSEEQKSFSIPDQDIPKIGDVIDAYICHVDDINRFFIHRADSEVLELSEKIQAYYETERKEDALLTAKIGDWCCACYENQWYRGKIILAKRPDVKVYRVAANNTNTTSAFGCKVQYIDYGNLESVSSDKMKQLKSEFCKLPPQALQCNLHDMSLEQLDLAEEAKAYFKNKTDDQLLKVTVKDLKDNIIYVELHTAYGESVNEYLVAQELAVFDGKRKSSVKEEALPASLREPEDKVQNHADAVPGQRSSILQRLTTLSLEEEEEDIEVTNVEFPDAQYLDVLVSAVNNLNEVEVILLGSEYRGKLILLLEEMRVYYDKESLEELESVEEDGVYAAFYEDAWHRVRVLDVKDEDVEIDLIDRGDQSTIKFSDLRKLSSQFKQLPAQAISLTLAHVPDSDNADQIGELSDMVLGRSCVAETVDGLRTVVLHDTSSGKDININKEIMTKLSLTEQEPNYEPVVPKPGEQSNAFVVHITDAGIFYVKFPGPGVHKLDELIDSLTTHFAKGAKAADFVKQPELEKVYWTRWTEDGYLYRITVTCVMLEEQKVEVEFIDYGNRDIIQFSALREIPKHLTDLLVLPPQVLKCELANEGDDLKQRWKYGLASSLTEELISEMVVVKVVKEAADNKLTTVNILRRNSEGELVPISIFSESNETSDDQSRLNGGGSLTSSSTTSDASGFLDEKQRDSDSKSDRDRHQSASVDSLFLRSATAPALRVKDGWITVHVTAVQSPSKFYFQLQDGIIYLSELMVQMNEFYKDTEDCLEDCCAGDVCAVFVAEDNLWYRCVIHSCIDIEGEMQVCVFFVDFGTLIFVPVDDVRPLDAQFLYLPFQAIKASLSDSSPVGQSRWSKKAKDAFAELTVGRMFRAQINQPASYPVLLAFPQERSLSVTLYDTCRNSSEWDICINESLLNSSQ